MPPLMPSAYMPLCLPAYAADAFLKVFTLINPKKPESVRCPSRGK